MMYDLVFPNNNEKELFENSIALGFDGVIFAYKNKVPQKKIIDNKIIYLNGIVANPLRKDFENKATTLVYDMELGQKRDFIHHRNSGLNHVLVNLAKNNNIVIGFNFSNILLSQGKNRSVIIGRQMQNINIAKTASFAIFSGATKPMEQRAPQQLKKFYGTLGMSTQKQKEAFSSLVTQQKHI